MDGGKGQLSSALADLEAIGLGDMPIVGLAKQREEIFFPHQSQPLCLPHSTGALKLMQRIRDEAHRFAIEYHRSLRSKEQVHSVLDDIPGIGETRRKALMRRFRSIENIRDASVEELSQTESMNMQSAESVYAFFHKIQH